MQQPPDIPIRLTRAQVREVDRRSIEEFHLPGIVLMENAARAVTDAALDMLRRVEAPSVLIVCGGGNNGGDGLAVARHLHNHRVDVTTAFAVDPSTYRGDAQINWHVARAMSLRHIVGQDAHTVLSCTAAHLIIDALFGTGLHSPPREPKWIDLMNASPTPVLAIDLPSGLDCDTGEPLGAACVRATRTVTFVAEKVGFANPRSRPYLGEILVGDVGCPRELIQSIAASPTSGPAPQLDSPADSPA